MQLVLKFGKHPIEDSMKSCVLKKSEVRKDHNKEF